MSRTSHVIALSALALCLAAGVFTTAHSSSASTDPLEVDGVHTVLGLRYLEVRSGGAFEDDALPMIVLLHGMGLRPRMFAPILTQFPMRARFIVPYGYLPSGQGFEWFEPRTATLAPGPQLNAAMPGVAEQIASALNAIRTTRRTTGKIILGGFSQGAELTYGLALMHPEMFVRACPMAGALTPELLKRPRANGLKPEVHGFHGDDDTTIRIAAGQFTISSFTSLGYVADLKTFHGVGHNFLPAIDDVSACLQEGVRVAVTAP